MAMARDRRHVEPEKWSDLRPHEEFLELCAVSTSGELTEEEESKLQDHLEGCPECRQALSEFEAVVRIGVPPLAAVLCGPMSRHTPECAKEPIEVSSPGLLPALDAGRSVPNAGAQHISLSLACRNGPGHLRKLWNYTWLSFAAAVFLAVVLGICSFALGRRRGPEVVQVTPRSTDYNSEALDRELSARPPIPATTVRDRHQRIQNAEKPSGMRFLPNTGPSDGALWRTCLQNRPCNML